MFYRKNRCKWNVQPAGRQQHGSASRIRGIGERDIICTRRETLRKLNRVGAMYGCFVPCVELFDVGAERSKTGCVLLDEVRAHSASRQRLESQCTGTCKKIEHSSSRQILLEDAHPRLTDSVERW